MTRDEWLSSDDPAAMLRALELPDELPQGRSRMPSDRKLRLFAVACFRRNIAASVPPSHSDCVIAEQVERWADGGPRPSAAHRPGLSYFVLEADAIDAARGHCGEPLPADRAEVAALLRDVVGDPFARLKRPFPPNRLIWTPEMLRAVWLARAAYDERLPDGSLDPVRLAILADALEEAGCADEAILRHLRGFEPHVECGGRRGYLITWRPACFNALCDGWQPLRGPHVRGCHALDLLLGLT